MITPGITALCEEENTVFFGKRGRQKYKEFDRSFIRIEFELLERAQCDLTAAGEGFPEDTQGSSRGRRARSD